MAVLLLAAFSSGAFIGRATGILGGIYENSSDESDEVATDRPGEFRFVHPLSGRKNPDRVQARGDLKPFRYKVAALIESKLRAHDASALSVYFRDLNGGHHFGIRENETFSSESLLKLPLMIAYFKWSESDPLVLKRRVAYTGNIVREERPVESSYQPLEAGKSYTVDDLIFRMIVHDDADAHALLAANLSPGYLDRIFKDIYVNYDPGKKDSPVPFSAYASFYRVLYRASYLNKETSEKALHTLSRSVFKSGMVAGIPSNVDCAFKFGRRMIDEGPGSADSDGRLTQLHAFGIVYQPSRPYLMGVMARGEDADKLVAVIRDITTLIYDEVDRQSR